MSSTQPTVILELCSKVVTTSQFSFVKDSFRLCFVMTLVTDAWPPSACKRMYYATLLTDFSYFSKSLDMFYWEPVGALISTVLSQMILGSRVYAVCSPLPFHYIPQI